MTRRTGWFGHVAAAGTALLLLACGDAGKQTKAAYDVCLASAKADSRVGRAQFEDFEKATIGVSTGDSDIRINIPYDLNGQKGSYQCIAGKQTDGTYKVVF